MLLIYRLYGKRVNLVSWFDKRWRKFKVFAGNGIRDLNEFVNHSPGFKPWATEILIAQHLQRYFPSIFFSPPEPEVV